VLTGLKSVAVFMKDALPAAVRCYGLGFKEAWGEPTDKAPWASFAWKRIAQGHVLFLMALLMGIVAYLTRGKGDFGALLTEVRASKKLGPKMAEWIEANKDDLLKNPELQPKASAGGGGAEAPSSPSSLIPPPTRGQSAESLAKVNRGKAPYSELNASVAELNGYRAALDKGRIGVIAPGKASASGLDFATYDPVKEMLYITDAKYRGPGGTYPATVPQAKMDAWTNEVRDVVSNWSDSPLKDSVLNAIDNGNVDVGILKWP
jgi:hypothetical protein